jgi:hypothetical protein
MDSASSPTTFFGSSLLSPDTISHGDISTLGTSTGSEGRENGAYAQLWRHYQQSEREWVKLQKELECLKYVLSSLSFSNNPYVVHIVRLLPEREIEILCRQKLIITALHLLSIPLATDTSSSLNNIRLFFFLSYRYHDY